MRKLAALAFALSSLALFAERDTAIYRGKLTSDLNANGNRIVGVASPSAPGDVANKEYVDSIGGVTPQFVTNAANAVVTSATNALRLCDGAARPLPRYLHALDFADSYPEAAAEYYRSRGDGKTDGGCSSVRDGGFLYRNFDYPFDERAEFIVRMSAGPAIEQSNNPNNRTIRHRYASVGVAQVGTNLTEAIVTSGKPNRCYKWLPSATVDGINENGVACNINVVDGDPQTSGWHNDTGDLHPLAAVRWILDHATNAQHAATYIASHIAFPQGWRQNFHYMIADAEKTYIVENGSAHDVTDGVKVLTNFRLYPTPSDGEGRERYDALVSGANITSQWWTLTYTAAGYRASDLPGITGQDLTNLFNYWENNPRESHRGERFGDKVWWQSIHTSIYDITNRTLRVAVQEVDDWYTFAVPSAGGVKPEAVREIVRPMIASSTNGLRRVEDMAVYEVIRTENTDWTWTSEDAEAQSVLDAMTDKVCEWRYMYDQWHVDGSLHVGGNSYSLGTFGGEEHSSTSVSVVVVKNGSTFDTSSRAIRPRYMDETLGPAKTNQQLSAVATDNASKPSNGDLVKYDAANDRFVKAEKSSTSADPANADYRDPQDNTCHKTEYVEWTNDVDARYNPRYVQACGVTAWFIHNGDTLIVNQAPNYSDPGATELHWGPHAWDRMVDITFTRSAVCTNGKKFVTDDVVDGKVSAAVSTNNPAFVSAVRNTPTENMPEDMPTDWGTYGTVGAALAALAAFVKWAKAKIVAVIGDDEKPTDTFVTDLLGKPVAKTALMIPLEAKTDSFAAEEGHAYAVTMTGTVTITMPTTTAGKAAIFQARFSAAAQQSVQFDTDDVVKFDGADCGIVKAGKDALLSAMWNGEAWDLVWKNEA